MKNINGYIYFYIHFIIEIVSFYILGHYIDYKYVVLLDLLYDFLAFVPQGLFGYLYDKYNIKNSMLIIGVLLSSISLLLLHCSINPFINICIISISSCLIHISGAEDTLRTSNGRISPVAIFVSGGSFGLILGRIMAQYNINYIFILLLNLTILISMLFINRKLNNLDNFNYTNKNIDIDDIIVIALFVVAIRAFMGYGIPTSWNKTLIQNILLYFLMGTGKAMGGILIDKIGINKTIFISTICSTPFLLFGNNIMIISLIGVMLFSMTMAITLALLVSVLKKYPGIAFGITTIGLFLGTLPMFFIRINSIIINSCVIIVLTIISYLLLKKISIKKEN